MQVVKKAGLILLCALVMLLTPMASAEIILSGGQNVTVNFTGGRANELYSLLAVASHNGDYSVDAQSILYANQFRADGNGHFSVTFIRTSFPETVFLVGGSFPDNSASPRVIGEYAPGADDFVLPASLAIIEEEAFAGCPFVNVVLDDAIERIDSRAFADCGQLKHICIPGSVSSIADDAFEGCGRLTVQCKKGTAAYSFAANRGYTIELID